MTTRSAITNSTLKKLLLLECVTRVLKSHLRRLLRAIAHLYKLPGDSAYRQITAKFLNLVIGRDTEKSLKYWSVYMKKALEEKFSTVLSNEEKGPSFDLQKALKPDIPELLARFLQVTSIR